MWPRVSALEMRAVSSTVWVYVQAGIEYCDTGDHATALSWLTPGLELALRTGAPE